MTSSSEHWEVAPYALGVLDEHDSDRFESHLAECDRCAAELESLLPVTTLLADVDPASIGQDEASHHGGRLLHRMVNTVSYERSRAQARRTLVLAAGVVAIVLLIGLSFAFGRGTVQPSTVAKPPPATVTPPPTGAAARTADPGTGIGGPEVSGGERFEVTDPATGARVLLLLGGRSWGTEVSFSLANVGGPLAKCELVAFDVDGSPQVVATWSMPKDGYGTPAHPTPLLLQAATAVPRKDLDRFEVRSVQPGGASVTIAVVRV